MNTIPLLAGSADAQHAINMTSREIAELTGKRHDHVIRDIRAILTHCATSLGVQPEVKSADAAGVL